MDERLVQIYNTLMNIEVRGESAFAFADAMRALRAYIQENTQQPPTAPTPVPVEEAPEKGE